MPGVEKVKLSSEIWRRFMISVRRSKLLTKHRRAVQYVKVLEIQKNGSPHYHVFFDRWIERYIINSLWEKAILSIVWYWGKSGNAYVEGIKNRKAAAAYVSKYLVKTINELQMSVKLRIWSKSNKTSIFDKKPFYTPWLFCNLMRESLYLLSLRATSQEFNRKYWDFYLTADKEFKYIANVS